MPRAGTTFLYNALARHPRIFVPPRKELEYFSVNFGRGPTWYAGFFQQMPADSLAFDISPMYFLSPDAAQRITAHPAAPKVVLMVRDPAEFAVSFYKNRLATYGKFASFERFLEICDYSKDGQTLRISLHPGAIETAIERFRGLLGDRLLICNYGAMEDDALRVLIAIERFNGLPRFFDESNVDKSRVNASDQLGHAWINRLAHQKWFADAVMALVPGRLLRALRLRYQSKRRGKLLTDEEEGRYAAAARTRFERDRQYVATLFAGGDFVTGSGKRLPGT
jgi:hypothetical protein